MKNGCGAQNNEQIPAMMKIRQNGCERTHFIECANRRAGDPVFNLVGNITGMAEKQSPVSNMKMYYQTNKNGPPELNFDIDLVKNSGEDEKFCLSNEPTAEEKEFRMQEKLNRLECELEDLQKKLLFVKRLRTEWNAQKASLCNRKLKDKPLCDMEMLNKYTDR